MPLSENAKSQLGGSQSCRIIALSTSPDLREQIEKHTNETSTLGNLENINYGVMVPLSGLLVIVQVIISIYIFDFYKNLPTQSEIQNLLV